MKRLFLALLVLISGVAQAQFVPGPTPKYVFFPGEYDNMILNTTTHKMLGMFGIPTVISGMPNNAVSGAGGAHHQCVIDSVGNCYCWGDNANGEIGNGTTVNVNSPLKISVDSAGAAFANIKQVLCGGTLNGWSTAALKTDGTVWVWGATDGGIRGNGTSGGTNTRPVKVTFPGGTVITKIQMDIIGIALDNAGNVWTWGASNAGFATAALLAQNTGSPVTNLPTIIPLPHPAIDIAGGSWYNYAILNNGKTYGWAWFLGYLGVGDTTLAYNQPSAGNKAILLDSTTTSGMHLPLPITKIYVNGNCSYGILTDSSLWAWGDASNGAIGNGREPNYSTYKNGTSSQPFFWDQGFGELMVRRPVQIGVGIKFTDVFTSNALTYYFEAIDKDGNLYCAGRNKGGIIGNGVTQEPSGNQAGTYPNGWDVPRLTKIVPFSYPGAIVSPSPYCVTHPAGSFCSVYTIPTTSNPNANAGGNKGSTGSSTTLNGISSGNGVARAVTTLWTKISGPSNPSFLLETGDTTLINGLVNGTYVFQQQITDNNWRTNTSTMTLTVTSGFPPPTVDAGPNQFIVLLISSTTLTGTATGNGGATITSTTWSQISGPNTATISSPSSLTTNVIGLVSGLYVFQLSATDSNNNTSTSQVSVTITTLAGSLPRKRHYHRIYIAI